MADGKEYIARSEEYGNINISEDVIAVIAATATSEVEGVTGLSANLGSDLVELLGKKNLAKGVRISFGESGALSVNVAIQVKYGAVVPDVAKSVQDAVYTALESVAGVTPAEVNIEVAGVGFEKPAKK